MKFIKDNGFWNVVQDDQEGNFWKVRKEKEINILKGRTLLHDLMDGSYNGENPKVRLQMLDMIVSDPGCDVCFSHFLFSYLNLTYLTFLGEC